MDAKELVLELERVKHDGYSDPLPYGLGAYCVRNNKQELTADGRDVLEVLRLGLAALEKQEESAGSSVTGGVIASPLVAEGVTGYSVPAVGDVVQDAPRRTIGTDGPAPHNWTNGELLSWVLDWMQQGNGQAAFHLFKDECGATCDLFRIPNEPETHNRAEADDYMTALRRCVTAAWQADKRVAAVDAPKPRRLVTPPCPKCGGETWPKWHGCIGEVIDPGDVPHLRAKCQACGFSWKVPALDEQDAQP